MNSKGVTKLLIVAATASAIGISASTVLAQTNIADIEGQANATAAFVQSDPVVTVVGSTPGTVADGYTYASWQYFVQDSSGSLDVFYSSTKATGYTPTVGDEVSVQGEYSPFDDVPEIENGNGTTLPAIGVTKVSSGNTVPAPPVLNISQVNVGIAPGQGTGAAIMNTPYVGYYVQLDDVTISGVGSTWTTHANDTGTITDGSGSMTLFLYASSYSDCGLIATDGGLDPTGAAVPTGPVDMDGYVDYFAGSSEAEFVPLSITSVPEPTMMGLYGLGSVLAGLFCYRFRKTA
jgi:hypothetical protein